MWGDWVKGECSKTCGSGTRTKTRTEKVPQSNNGSPCQGSSTDTENCNTKPCPGEKL